MAARDLPKVEIDVLGSVVRVVVRRHYPLEVVVAPDGLARRSSLDA
jgi:hypothetical protein